MDHRMRRRVARGAQYILLGLAMVLLLFPVYWMVNTSFKTVGEVQMLPQSYWPTKPTLAGYRDVFRIWKFGPTFVNTFLVAAFSTLGATVLGAMAAYGFNRFNFPGKGVLFGFLIVSIALPGMVLVGPVFLAYRSLGLMDTKTGLILIDLVGGLPFAVYFLYAFFETIPRELDDAAAIDGCSWFGALRHIVIPLSAPGVAIATIMLFIGAWNEFLFANVLTMSEKSRVLTVRMLEIPTQHLIPYNLMAVGGMFCIVPVIVIVATAQRQIVEGLTAGSFK